MKKLDLLLKVVGFVLIVLFWKWYFNLKFYGG